MGVMFWKGRLARTLWAKEAQSWVHQIPPKSTSKLLMTEPHPRPVLLSKWEWGSGTD